MQKKLNEVFQLHKNRERLTRKQTDLWLKIRLKYPHNTTNTQSYRLQANRLSHSKTSDYHPTFLISPALNNSKQLLCLTPTNTPTQFSLLSTYPSISITCYRK